MSVLPLYNMWQYCKLFPSESLPITAEGDTLFHGDEVTIKENQIARVLPAPNSGAILVQRSYIWYQMDSEVHLHKHRNMLMLMLSLSAYRKQNVSPLHIL